MEAEAARECSAILLEEHYAYVQTMRAELLDAKPASKHWWAKVRRIRNRKQQVSSIPALKDGANWILEADAKANCFATTFESKNTMIDEEANEYTEILDSHPTFYCGLATVEATEQALKTLDEDSALGPDTLPTRILKQRAHVLTPVLHKLILAILAIGQWPALWMVHWIVPLFKRKSVYLAGN